MASTPYSPPADTQASVGSLGNVVILLTRYHRRVSDVSPFEIDWVTNYPAEDVSMGHSNEPGSDSMESKGEDGRSNQVISLCHHRHRRDVEDSTERLIDYLETIHCRAIEVHNRIIEKASVSILTELCRTVGVVFDRVCDELKAAVITPAALYGDSGGDIFGKRPLQRRIARSIDDETTGSVFEKLKNAHPAVWEVGARNTNTCRQVLALAGADAGQTRPVAAVICREGRRSESPGVYTGWAIEFQGHRFIVFGHRLDRRREVAVRDLLACRDDRHDPRIWKRLELSLIRAIIDPDANHPRPTEPSDGPAIRRPASRRGLVSAIRLALWRHFAEPEDGLTIHAHIAALAGDSEAYAAFIDEVRELAEAVTIKLGGLPEGKAPIDVDELLRPFFADRNGRLHSPTALCRHPSAVLLLDEPILAASDVSGHHSIAAALKWADDHPKTTAAQAVRLAWMTYRTEQNLMATYGRSLDAAPRSMELDHPPFACLERSAILPNLRILFDPRFMEHSLADLDIGSCHRRRIQRALRTEGRDIDSFSLAELERDERDLARFHGISHRTCNKIRNALLELATNWRWRQCGLDPELVNRLRDRPDDDFSDGLDVLAEWFES